MNGFLFDENVPNRLTFKPKLSVTHTSELGETLSDSFIWDHARKNSYVIVSKDADFSNRIMMSSPPPWIVHLRFGNLKKRDFHAFLARVWPQVEALLPEHKLINVYMDRVEAVK